MNSRKIRFASVRICLCLLSVLHWLPAQQTRATLTGTITADAGQLIANAKVSAKNLASGRSAETQSDSAGKYRVTDLAPGDYEVSIHAIGFAVRTSKVTLTSATSQTVNFILTAEETPNAPAPNKPSTTSASPSLQDLGFSTEQTNANPQLQAILQKRTDMLKMHQRLGLITTIPMTAAVITGPYAKAKGKNGETIKEPTQANLDAHAALGGLTTALYFTSASYAILAPRVPGTKKHGAIRWHEALAFVHGPGMVLTPVLGIMAYKQENAGEKVHGIASAHGTVAYITAASYGAAILAVSWPINVKFWKKK
jgi:Carboxypeptidase regulatory-like domain